MSQSAGIDYSRRGKASKRKGANGENEVRDLLREYGWDTAHRNLQSGGQGGGDLVEAIDGWHIECKRVEKLSLSVAWRQADEAKRPTESVLLAHRGNWHDWMATVLLREFFGMPPFVDWQSVAIGSRASVRGEFLGHAKRNESPMVISSLSAAGECVATVWLRDLLFLIKQAQHI